MTRLTPTQFDGLTIEERDAYLERRDEERRQRAIDAAGTKPIEDVLFGYAAIELRLNPSLIFDLRKLAKRAAALAREDGIKNPRTGEPYADKTAYNYINPQRQRLLDVLREPLPERLNAP